MLLKDGYLVFIARKLPHTLRVYVYASDDNIRVDRVVNRDHMTVNEARV